MKTVEQQITEELSSLIHEQWSGWMKYMFQWGIFDEKGNFVMDAKQATRWMRQMNTPYSELPENEKQSDRIEAQKFLEFFKDLQP